MRGNKVNMVANYSCIKYDLNKSNGNFLHNIYFRWLDKFFNFSPGHNAFPFSKNTDFYI